MIKTRPMQAGTDVLYFDLANSAQPNAKTEDQSREPYEKLSPASEQRGWVYEPAWTHTPALVWKWLGRRVYRSPLSHEGLPTGVAT